MKNEGLPGIPSHLASFLIARHRYDELLSLIEQTQEVIRFYVNLIHDTKSRLIEIPDCRQARQQLQELIQSARLYAEYHHQFTQQIDLETSFRHEGGDDLVKHMEEVVSARQQLLHLLNQLEATEVMKVQSIK